MAINTSGFVVGNMPQVGLPNPADIAFDPNKLTQGVLQSYQLADAHYKLQETKARIAAQRKLQDELDALHDDRLAAAAKAYKASAAKSEGTIQTAPLQAQNEVAQLGQQARTIPLQGNLDVATLGNNISNANFQGTQLPIIQQAQAVGNLGALASAPDTAEAKGVLANIALRKGIDESANLTEDLDTARELAKAKVESAAATADQARAAAELSRQKPSMAEAKNAADIKKAEISAAKMNKVANDVKMFNTAAEHAANEAAKYDSLKVVDPSNPKGPLIPLPDVIRAAFDEDPTTGKLTQKKDGLFTGKIQMTQTLKDMIKRRQDAIDAAAEAKSRAIKLQESYLREEHPDLYKATVAPQVTTTNRVARNKAEYDALPPGEFTGPDGKKYVKPAK